MISSKSTINANGRVKLAIFIICLVGGIELTLASRSCKRTVMKIVTKHCSSDAELRSRRATEDGEKKDMWQSLVAEMLPTTVNGINKIVGDNLETFLDKVLLILKESLTSIITGQSNSISTDEQHRQRRSSPMLEKSAQLATTGGPMYKLSINEVEDLYAEIFKGPHRRPSMTTDKAKALLINIAAKCCRNVDTCLRKKIIDCP